MKTETENPSNDTQEMPNHDAAFNAAMVSSFAFLIPGAIVFVYFGISFYRKLADHATNTRAEDVHRLLDTPDLLHQTDGISMSGYSFRSAGSHFANAPDHGL